MGRSICVAFQSVVAVFPAEVQVNKADITRRLPKNILALGY